MHFGVPKDRQDQELEAGSRASGALKHVRVEYKKLQDVFVPTNWGAGQYHEQPTSIQGDAVYLRLVPLEVIRDCQMADPYMGVFKGSFRNNPFESACTLPVYCLYTACIMPVWGKIPPYMDTGILPVARDGARRVKWPPPFDEETTIFFYFFPLLISLIDPVPCVSGVSRFIFLMFVLAQAKSEIFQKSVSRTMAPLTFFVTRRCVSGISVNLSATASHRILKMIRTKMALAGSDGIRCIHLFKGNNC